MDTLRAWLYHIRYLNPQRLPLFGVIALAYVLRLHTLADAPIWYDEGLVGWAARLSWLESARWTASDVHPPGYFWLMSGWRLIVGEQPFVLRWISVAAGVLTVALSYKLGARLAGLQGTYVGLLAALLVATSRFSIWWSQELRMYSVAAALTLVSVWCTLKLLHGGASRKVWAVYIASVSAGLLTLYLFVVVLLIESLYVLTLFSIRRMGWVEEQKCEAAPRPNESSQNSHANRKATAVAHQNALTSFRHKIRSIFRRIRYDLDWRLLGRWGAAQIAIALSVLPWLLYMLTQYRSWSVARPFDFVLFMQVFATLLAVGDSLNVDSYALAVGFVWAILLAASSIWLYRRVREWRLRREAGARPRSADALAPGLVALLLLAPPLGVYLAALPRTFFYTPRIEARYLLPFAWSFYLSLAWGLWYLRGLRPALGNVLMLATLVVSGATTWLYFAGRQPQDYYESIAAQLRAYRQPNDGVLLHSDRNWPMFAYHYDGAWRGVPNGAPVRATDADDSLKALWAQSDGVWLIVTEDALRIDTSRAIEQWLAARSVLTHTETFGLRRLIFYARTEARAQLLGARQAEAQPSFKWAQSLSANLRLQGYDQVSRRLRVGDELLLGLYWENRGAEAEVVVALRDASGALRKRERLSIAPAQRLTLVRFALSSDLPVGSYDVMVFAGQIGLRLSQLTITQTASPTSAQAANIQNVRSVRFENGIELVGYDAPTLTLRAGEALPLTLYWQTNQPITQSYKVFTHLLGQTFNPQGNNFLWGQHDQEPLNGAWPTRAWQPGQLVSDAYTIPLAKNAPAGQYIVEIGFYHATTGERLRVVGADGSVDDHVVLMGVEVR